MAAWKHVAIAENMLRRRTDKAVLIAMPCKSEYSGFMFWHPAKLVRGTSISYTDEFVFRLKKYGRGKYNSFEVVSEMEITTSEFESAMAMMCDYEPEDDEPEIHTPEPLEPEHAEALPELRDE